MQDPLRQPPYGAQHNGQNRGFDPEESSPHCRCLLVMHIDHAQRQNGHRPRQYKQQTSHYAAAHPVQQPAKIDCQLLRFGPGQQHAEIQRVKKPSLADPFQLVNKQTVHHRDLAGRATKAEKADLQPDKYGYTKGNGGDIA